MAAEVAAAGAPLHGGKFWEKRRRDRLKDSFSKLARLLPNHDPSKLPSQNDILIKATTFISELRLSNLRLLSDAEDEKSKLIMQLQDEVNKLIVRVKQLMQLLRKAKIEIPAGPEILALGKRPGEKGSTSDTENAKKTRQDCTANPASDDSADDVIEVTAIQINTLANVPVAAPLRDSNINAKGKQKKAKSPKKTNLQSSSQAQSSVGATVTGVAITMPSVSTATSVPLQIPLRTVSLPTFITIPQPCVTILPQHINVTDKTSSQLILPKPLVTAPCPRVAISRLANTRPPKKKFKRNRKKKIQMTRTDAQIQTQESIELVEAAEKETTSSTDAHSQRSGTETTQKTSIIDSASGSTPPEAEKSIENSGVLLTGSPLASSSNKDVVCISSSGLANSVPTASGANKHKGPESETTNQQSTVVTTVQAQDTCATLRTEEKETEAMVTSPQKVHEFMSDTFKDIEEILMPHNQQEQEHSPTDSAQPSVVQPHESAQNNTQQQPQESEQLSSAKISECIARSMDLIDQSGPDLMDLSGDWPNTSSPKSPLSPTKMFLSMFPLALRENPSVGATSTPGPEVSSASSKITAAAASSTAKSSFHIDSMLPTEEMSGRTSACNTPLPMAVPGMIGHQPTSLHSLSTDDYLSMVSNFVSGTGTKSSTFDQFNFGLTGDLEGTEVSNPFSFSLNLPTFDTPGEQLVGGNKCIPDHSRSRPDKRFSTPFAPNILDSSHQTATPTNFSFTLSNTASYAAAIPAPKLDTESKKKSASRNAISTDGAHHVDQRHQLSAGASSRHVGHQVNQRSSKHQTNPMQFTISDLMSTSPQQVSASVPRQSSTSKTNQGITKADTCQYKPYENPSSSSAATSQQIFSQPVNQPISSSQPQTYTNLLPSFNPKTGLPNLPPGDPNSRQQKQPKSTKQAKSGDSRSQNGPLRSYRTLSDSVVDITRKSSETWSSSSYRYYDTGYLTGSAQSFAPNVASNSYNEASMNRHPVSQATNSTRNSEATAPPKFNKASDKPKSGNTKGAKASGSSGRRASAQSNQQMQLPPPPLRHPENGGQHGQLLQLRPPPVPHHPSEGFMDMGNNGRNSFGFLESVPNRLQFTAGADTVPLPQPMHQPVDKSRIGFDFGDRNVNLMQNTFQQQQHSAHDIKSKQMPPQSRQSSSKNFQSEHASNSTRNPTSSSTYGNQSHPSSNKKKSTEPPTSNMHQNSPQSSAQQHGQHNQFQGSYNQNQSGNMWIYDQPKAPNMRTSGSHNQPSFQKSTNAFSVSKLVGNVESQQQQQQPRHFVEGLLGKNTPTPSPWIMASGADAHPSANVSDQGFGYYQQPEGQMEYFNYNPAYHQTVPQVSNNGQNFSNDQGNHQGQSGQVKSSSHSEIAHYPSYPSSNNQLQQQQQQHDRNRQNNEVQQFPRFQHHPATKIDQHSAPANQSSSHQQMQQQQQHHPGTSSVSNFNLSSIFPEVNQDISNRPPQHQQHLNVQSHGNSHQRNTSGSGHFYR